MFRENEILNSLYLTLCMLLIIACGNSNDEIVKPPSVNDSSLVVSKHGQLSISGSKILDKNGSEIALRGMSLFWSQWAPNYYNRETIQWLRDDWRCTIVRAALGVEPEGYLQDSYREYQKIKIVIDACIELGIYVLVDWHDHNAEDHLMESITFFNNISKEYGGYPNIIYEIYNEPLDVEWKGVIKPYAEQVINTIRANDPHNLIVVGTRNWSQEVEEIIGNEIDHENLAYSLHFYTGTHRQWLRDKANKALNANIPIFVSEWGLSKADAQGDIDQVETGLWLDFMEQNNLSWCNWSVNNKDETTSILLPSTSKLSGWSDSELTEAGKIMRAYLRQENAELFE